MSKIYISLATVFLMISSKISGDELVQSWIAFYNGPASGNDAPRSLIIDSLGNVYIVGRSEGYTTSDDFVIIKYSPQGDSLWVRRYNGPENLKDGAIDLAIDDSGYLYVTGQSQSLATNFDIVILKLSPDGELLRKKKYNGSANGGDLPSKIVLDSHGDVIIAGYSQGKNTGDDFVTIKYSPRGETLWTRRYQSYERKNDRALALGIDEVDNVYVAGFGGIKKYFSSDYLTIKYTHNGSQLWVSRYDGPGNHTDIAQDLAIDEAGFVYVTGYSESKNPYDYDVATIKYSPSGDTLWTRRFTGQDNESEYAFFIKNDSMGAIYVAGITNAKHNLSTQDSILLGDLLLLKYSTDGSLVWQKTYDSPDHRRDIFQDIKLDRLGNIFLIGISWTKDHSADFVVLKYSSEGQLLWEEHYNGPFNLADYPQTSAVDKHGNFYVTGVCDATGIYADIVTIKYSPKPDSQ